MDNTAEKRELAEKLARQVMTLSKNNLLLNLRFLDVALSSLEPQQKEGEFQTDGKKLWYDPVKVLRIYKDSADELTRLYLHSLMHCVFSHPFVSLAIDREKWDIACDIAVEAVIFELRLRCTQSARQVKQKEWLDELGKTLKHFTAEKIYRHLIDLKMPPERFESLKKAFLADDHSKWYEHQNSGNGENDGGSGGKSPNNSGGSSGGNGDGNGNGNGSGGGNSLGGMSEEQLKKMWKDIAGRMQTEIEAFGKSRGNKAGNLTQNLSALSREKYDYSAFLKKFAVRGEVMKVNDDEFDYIFYTYGLQLYERMPLIEPLEYKEVKKVREFVIAIDTSGSVSGELVQKFVQKTYNILKSTESFFSKVNIVIIQCDAQVQEAVTITCEEDFDRYIKDMKLKGFGGTDFRPVFKYIDSLIDEGQLKDLKGMIYFTDGHGAFPSAAPRYDTAFVYIDDEYNNPNVPLWAMKLVLESEEI